MTSPQNDQPNANANTEDAEREAKRQRSRDDYRKRMADPEKRARHNASCREAMKRYLSAPEKRAEASARMRKWVKDNPERAAEANHQYYLKCVSRRVLERFAEQGSSSDSSS